MADDVTAKLNAINSKYNARNFVVYMEENEYVLADIERNIIENNVTVAKDTNDVSNELVADENNEKTELVSEDGDEGRNRDSEQNLEKWTKIIGNHMVTAVDIPEENITLIIDSTNPSLGILKNGEIHMFSTKDGSGLEVKPIGMALLGVKAISTMQTSLIESYFNSNKSIKALAEIYGPQAQNEALKRIERKELELYKQELNSINTFYDNNNLDNEEHKTR